MPDVEDRTFGLRAWSGHSRGMVVAHRHFDLELNYLLEGTMTYLIGGAVVTLPLRRLCVLWGGMAHQTLNQTRSPKAFWVTAPLSAVLGWGLPEGLMRQLLGEGIAIDSLEMNDEQLLQRWIDDLASGSNAPEQHVTDKSRIVLLELEARLRRLSLHFETRNPSAAVDSALLGSGLSAVEILARYICDHYADDIAVEQIAAAAHLHPNYAMTLFRRHTGMTINGYLILQRIAHAQRLLATTERSVSDIARQSGFGSLSRFYEAFQRQTGSTPKAFRQSAVGRPIKFIAKT